MEKVYHNLLNENEQNFITQEMLTMVRLRKCIDESEAYNMNSLGVMNLPSTTSFIKRFTNLLEKDYGDIKYVNTYTRMYRNGSVLPPHTDKEQLELTLSVCSYNTTGVNWEMCVSSIKFDKAKYGLTGEQLTDFDDIKLNSKGYATPVGSGVTCFGAINPHWRDPLICDNDGIIIQTFYHWKFCV